MKVITQHRCVKRHRTNEAFARCVWPHTSVSGSGPFAVVITCPDPRVVLVKQSRWALTLLIEFDVFSCGPLCEGAHELVEIGHDRAARQEIA